MNEITRLKDEIVFGLQRRYVFGLNIFAANRVNVDAKDDPRLIFLRVLCARSACAAHTGNLFDLALSPHEMFGPPHGENAYIMPDTGVYGGMFYNVSSWPDFPACLFPEIKDKFWKVKNLDDSAGIREILELDALAVYVEPFDNTVESAPLLLHKSFNSHQDWLNLVAGLFKLVILTGGDGDFFSVFSRDSSHLDLLPPALDEAVESVQRTTWYHQHAANLEWDVERNMCLMLPHFMRG